MKIYIKRKQLISINLQFFSGEKTEKPTSKKRNDARKKGQVANSQELGTAFLFISSFYALKMYGLGIYESMLKLMTSNFELISDVNDIFNIPYLAKYVATLFQTILVISLPVAFIAMIAGVISNLIQVGWHPTLKPLQPKFSKLNPISGLKKLFSLKMFVDLAKALAKFLVVGIVIYNTIKKQIDFIPLLVDMTLMDSTIYISGVVVTIGLNVGFFIFICCSSGCGIYSV